ncbi:zona pellucida sperm-binding protein 4-like [Hemiscyllium ocellatum]|uniref:zona pellucida sperm-binding protein 4-like n=1 Tax=Hemiscyllium ocellatum TaxID=170820 RepID=UPI0029670097|nr:zona pellucida sperm-binding protein 4-like [Hemiscyllium ocellatum]
MGYWLVWCLCLWATRPFLVSAVCPPEPGWRLPCGLATINSTECIKQGCCFQSPSLSGQSCFYNLRDSPDGSYSWWYKDSDYPIQRILQESVFIEVRVKDRTDPMIVLRLRDCWATPVPAPDHEVQWSLLVNGCPYEGDDYLTLLHPVGVSSGLQFPTHHKRFEVKTFVFLDGVSEQPLSGQVYLHCSAEVCSLSAQDDCTPMCGPRQRRSTHDHEGTVVSAPGPILLGGSSYIAKKQLEANGE